RIGELRPIIGRDERGVRVRGAGPRGAGPFASLEGERLAPLEALHAGKVRCSRIRGGHRGIAPEEEALRAGPEPRDDRVVAILAEEVSVAIAGERAAALADPHVSVPLAELTGIVPIQPLGLPYRRLVVRETHMFSRELGGYRDGQAGRPRIVERFLVEAL